MAEKKQLQAVLSFFRQNLCPYLQCRELGLLGQKGFLLFRGVGVVTVLIQPVPEDLNGLLGQISPPFSLPTAPRAGRQIQRGVHTVLIVSLAARQHHQT